MNVIVTKFGVAVRQFREANDWSQEELAEQAGLNRSFIGEIERGTSIASIVTVDKIARALGVRAANLLEVASGD
jgi:transcriptional regulator with XRE-family HTH domain